MYINKTTAKVLLMIIEQYGVEKLYEFLMDIVGNE